MVPSAGVEPAILSLEGTCFIQLSYEGALIQIIPVIISIEYLLILVNQPRIGYKGLF